MDLLVSHLILRPFLDAYAVVARQLVEQGPGDSFDEARFVERCPVLARQWAFQRRIGEESVSGEMFRTALRLVRHRDLVTSTKPDVDQRREEFVREIDGYRVRLAQVAIIDERSRREDLIALDRERASRVMWH